MRCRLPAANRQGFHYENGLVCPFFIIDGYTPSFLHCPPGVMSFLTILVASFFATLSLGSPVARQTSLCSFASYPNASNYFTLLAVSIADTSVQTPLALGFPASNNTVPVIGVIVFFWAISLAIC